jgi:hypothetical protein
MAKKNLKCFGPSRRVEMVVGAQHYTVLILATVAFFN